MSNPFYVVRFCGINDCFCFDHVPRVGEFVTIPEEEMQEICNRKLVPLLPRIYKVIAVVHHGSEVCSDRRTELILEPAAEELALLRAFPGG